VVDHPLYTMWKQMQDIEVATERARANLRAVREQEQAEWRQAWDTYRRHWREGRRSPPARSRWLAGREWGLAVILWLLTPPATWLATWLGGRNRHSAPP